MFGGGLTPPRMDFAQVVPLPGDQVYYRPFDDEEGLTDDESAWAPQDLYESLKSGDMTFVFAFLLLCLPNLTTLSWQVECSYLQDLDTFIPVIRRLSLQDFPTVCPRLQQVTLRPLDGGVLGFDLLKALMTFPSVRSIAVERLSFGERENPYEPFPWPENSTLTHLTLDESTLDCYDDSLGLVQAMLAGCKSLEVFKLRIEPGARVSCSENDILKIIWQEAPLIQELAVIGFDDGAESFDSRFRLCDFAKIRCLETEFWILQSRDEYSFEYPPVDPLTQLPHTLQHLRLWEQSDENQKEHLDNVVKLLHHQEDLLPELRKLELYLLAPGFSSALGYFQRLISFIGQE